MTPGEGRRLACGKEKKNFIASFASWRLHRLYCRYNHKRAFYSILPTRNIHLGYKHLGTAETAAYKTSMVLPSFLPTRSIFFASELDL